jgi:hypothetical protein
LNRSGHGGGVKAVQLSRAVVVIITMDRFAAMIVLLGLLVVRTPSGGFLDVA